MLLWSSILFPFFLMISISFMTDDEAQGLSNNFRILSDFESGSTYYSGEGLDVRPRADVV
ncbi:hypothetical protein [Mycoplasmopsis felis]|uniref:hypothetical protein n=1 Tax=Mycoplasmopsis felis TaxID=33923 RepID=UPI002FF1A2BD